MSLSEVHLVYLRSFEKTYLEVFADKAPHQEWYTGRQESTEVSWLREENMVLTVLWKSLRHRRPQRSSEPTYYGRSHQILSENSPLRCRFHCLLVSSEVQKKYAV